MIFKPKQKNCLTKLVKIGDKQAKQDALKETGVAGSSCKQS
jgi:hypothetical protein